MSELNLKELDNKTSVEIDELIEKQREQLRTWGNNRAVLASKKYEQEKDLAETKELIRKASVEVSNIKSIIETLTSKFWNCKQQGL